jgi:hypothetical protein
MQKKTFVESSSDSSTTCVIFLRWKGFFFGLVRNSSTRTPAEISELGNKPVLYVLESRLESWTSQRSAHVGREIRNAQADPGPIMQSHPDSKRCAQGTHGVLAARRWPEIRSIPSPTVCRAFPKFQDSAWRGRMIENDLETSDRARRRQINLVCRAGSWLKCSGGHIHSSLRQRRFSLD